MPRRQRTTTTVKPKVKVKCGRSRMSTPPASMPIPPENASTQNCLASKISTGKSETEPANIPKCKRRTPQLSGRPCNIYTRL